MADGTDEDGARAAKDGRVGGMRGRRRDSPQGRRLNCHCHAVLLFLFFIIL